MRYRCYSCRCWWSIPREGALPIALLLLELHASFHLHQLDVVVGGTLTGSSAVVVGMQVGIGLRGTDVVNRVDGVVTTGDGLCHSHIAGVHGGSRDRAHGGDRVTSCSHLWDGGENRRRLHIRVELSALDKIVNGFFNLYSD